MAKGRIESAGASAAARGEKTRPPWPKDGGDHQRAPFNVHDVVQVVVVPWSQVLQAATH